MERGAKVWPGVSSKGVWLSNSNLQAPLHCCPWVSWDSPLLFQYEDNLQLIFVTCVQESVLLCQYLFKYDLGFLFCFVFLLLCLQFSLHLYLKYIVTLKFFCMKKEKFNIILLWFTSTSPFWSWWIKSIGNSQECWHYWINLAFKN